MKLLLLKLAVCFTAVLAAPADKQKKRDILPGDPRYGTEHSHHHEHEHHEHENEVQISKAAGGYVGSFTVPDIIVPEDNSFQVQPQTTYGPPNHTPGEPLGTDFFTPSDNDKTPASVLVPSTSYGIPDTTQLFNNYLGSVIDDKKPDVIKTIQEEPNFDTVHVKTVVPEVVHHEVHNVEQPAVIQKQVENIPQIVSLPQVKVTTSGIPTQTQGAKHSASSFTSSINSYPSHVSYTSYSNIPVKTLDHHVQVQVPQPYHVPVIKNVAVRIPVPHTVEVPKPYYVRVPQPVQVTVNRPYPVEVPRPVHYPVPHYVRTNVPVAQHVAVDVPVPHYVRTNVPVAQQVAVDVPVPQYVRTNVPVAQQVAVDVSKASPFQTFFDNTQSTFQNVLTGIPTFSNPLEGLQNSFENIDFSSFPPLSFIPSSIPSSIPFLPQVQTSTSANNINGVSSTNGDSVEVNNPVFKTDTTITKPTIVKPAIKTQPQPYKPSTACAGCIVTSSSSKKEFVQPTDANGGYVY